MKKMIVVLLVLFSVSLQGQTPLRDAVMRQATTQPPRQNPELYVSGLILSGIGGAMMGWGLGSPSSSVTCVSLGIVVSCAESGVNKGVWIGGGAAVAGAGFVMAAIGGKRRMPSVAFRPGGWAVTMKVR